MSSYGGTVTAPPSRSLRPMCRLVLTLPAPCRSTTIVGSAMKVCAVWPGELFGRAIIAAEEA